MTSGYRVGYNLTQKNHQRNKYVEVIKKRKGGKRKKIFRHPAVFPHRRRELHLVDKLLLHVGQHELAYGPAAVAAVGCWQWGVGSDGRVRPCRDWIARVETPMCISKSGWDRGVQTCAGGGSKATDVIKD